jgi:hypothetical protein
VLTSLAAGADQMGATIALAAGYHLQVVLPAAREEFARDIGENADSGLQPADLGELSPVCAFWSLLKRADRVYEFAASLGSGDTFGGHGHVTAYARAGHILLANCDLLIVIADDHASSADGGSVWLYERARELGLPTVWVPVSEPKRAELLWSATGRANRMSLFSPDGRFNSGPALSELVRELTLPPPSISASWPDGGWFERAYRRTLDIHTNEAAWSQRWAAESADRPVVTSLAPVLEAIAKDYGVYAIWADHRAGAYGEMYRGAAVLVSVLGALAVCCALLGLIWEGGTAAGKFVEGGMLLIMTLVLRRARRFRWRARYLSYRQIDRELGQTAWLALLGRGLHLSTPAHARVFENGMSWPQWYMRAVARQASLPNVCVDHNYVSATSALLLSGQVSNQVRYYRAEIAELESTHARLEQLSATCVSAAFALATLYCVIYLVDHFTSAYWAALRPIASAPWFHYAVTFCTGGLAAWAGTLTAIRTQGEFAQLAARYRGIVEALEGIDARLQRIREHYNMARITQTVSSSDLLLVQAIETSQVLLEEVHQWRTLFQLKEIERI